MIRKETLEFRSYNVLEGDYKIWLDKNESPFDLPKEVKEELLEEMKKVRFNRYPHIHSDTLREKIAEFLSFGKDNIIVGNGSDGLIPLFLQLFEGEHVVISSPTFGMYDFFARLLGIRTVDVPLGENFELQNVEDHTKNAKVVFICSPNNPTGNAQSREKIVSILETGVPVILDEAYVEFSGTSNIDLVKKYENLMVLRTFSKAFGLAGLRVGYAVGNEDVIKLIKGIKAPFNLNSLSAKAVEFMIDRYDLVKKNIEFIVKERERTLKSIGTHAYPSKANFLLVNLNAYDFLLSRGIVVRRLSGRLRGMIRITVGRREENDAVVEALKEFLADL
jgi:histidinol-phosphate aminotransferase